MFLFKKKVESYFPVFWIFSVSVQASQLENPRLSNVSRKICFNRLGCFEFPPPVVDPIQRTIFPLPEDEIITLFLLYSRTTKQSFRYLEPNEDSVRKSNFDPSLETKLLVPGYGYHMNPNALIMKLKDTLVDLGSYNVIFVNWTQSSSKSFPQAIANGRVVGAMIARLLQFLHENTSAPLQSMHIISHCLGCHVSGWAGERLRGLGRISALDPSAPYFYKAPNILRNYYMDADFVDVIHTNGGNNIIEGVALANPVGHIDFYPNGGSLQPGCNLFRDLAGENQDTTSGLVSQISLPHSCSQGRAIELYMESVDNSRCRFLGVACDSWEKYKNGECDEGLSAEMGFHAVKPKNITAGTKFYMKTNSRTPFCIQK